MKKLKTIFSVVLSLSIFIGCIPLETMAAENNTKISENNMSVEDVDLGTYSHGNNMTINRLLEQTKFTSNTGHGFAAEVGNNLIDRMKGQNASIVGNDNVKNGADRLIVGRDGSYTWIQDKYYNSARHSINACFEEGMFRYLDADGNAMQIEVPSDQYDDAVQIMREKIESGALKNANVTDPEDATKIVRKGNLTYNQAVNLAKAGTVESLKFDAVNGTVTATYALGISSLITYSISRLNGDEPKEALEIAAMEGLKTGGTVFATSIIVGQLSKQNTAHLFMPSSEALVNTFGDDFAAALLRSVGKETTGMTASAIRSNASKILRNQILTGGITVVLLSADDMVDIVRGRISVQQLIKNFAVTTAGVAGGYAGSVLGGMAGTAIAPGPGTAIGSGVGATLFGAAAGIGTEKVLGLLIKDDADQMMLIVEDNFYELGQDYILNEEEANNVAIGLQEKLKYEDLKDMYASDDRDEFAKAIIDPLMMEEVSKREVIKAPTEAEMRAELKASLEGVVFIH